MVNVQKLSNKHVLTQATQPTFQVMPGSGIKSYTNYAMNPKHNPYLAPSHQTILGYQMG